MNPLGLSRAALTVVAIAALTAAVLWLTDRTTPIEPTSEELATAIAKAVTAPTSTSTTLPLATTRPTPSTSTTTTTTPADDGLDATVARFVAAWTLQAGVPERRAALQPVVAPALVDALAVTYLDNLPILPLAGPPLINQATRTADYAAVTLVFAELVVRVEFTRFDGTWRALTLSED